MNKVAVVILNWNGRSIMEQVLWSVEKYSQQANNIYVIDNNSTDDSAEWLRNNYPNIKLILNQDNFGYAGGYNNGLKYIKEEYLILLNSDVEVTANWLIPIIESFDQNPNTAIIQPKILDYYKREYFEYAGACGGYIDKYGYLYCRGRIFDSIEKDNGQYDIVSDIFWASGACFAIRNNVFVKLGGFDPNFFAHQEEIDLCWRAFNEGYNCMYNYKSKVYHIGGATLKYMSTRKTKLNFRNSLLTMYKNLPNKNKFLIIFIRLCLDGIAGMRFVLKGEFSHCWAIIKAHFEFYSMIGSYCKDNKTKRDDYYNIKSIIYKYFINKKKQYGDL